MNAFLEQLAKFGMGRLFAIFGLTAGVAIALAYFTISMNTTEDALLFSGLETRDASQVTERLNSAGIAYTLRDGGSAVYVSARQVDEARMRVAADGALGFGSVGYEIFDQTDALGTTSFVQNVNAKRALEGELSRSINTIGAVASSRVLLVLPERRLFSQETQQPSASVILSVRGELNPGQVNTIRNLIATAVAGLQAGNITIADDQGRLLASPTDGESASSAALDGRREGFEADLRSKIRDVVEGVVGLGSARVVVTAELNRTSETISSQQFDPDGQVLRSTETDENSETEQNRENSGRVSASENLPSDESGSADAPTSTRNVTGGREVRNFEISSTTSTRIIEAGAVERLAVSVVVDYASARSEDGSITYTPRSEAEMQNIEELVRVAAGLREDRRDELVVRQMQFSRPDVTLGTAAPAGFSLDRADIFRIAELAVLFVTALLIVFMVARPLIQGAVLGPRAALAGAAATGGSAPATLPRQAQAALSEGQARPALTAPEEPEEHIDIDQIDGQVKKSSVKKVARLVDEHPDESLSILRNWMHEN